MWQCITVWPATTPLLIPTLKPKTQDKFLPQPYEQLASVLLKMGYEREAKKVMIQMNRDHAKFTEFLAGEWWWYNFFGKRIGYGYEPGRAFALSLLMVLLGTILFQLGHVHDIVSPSDNKA
jgi:hypothetical protein